MTFARIIAIAGIALTASTAAQALTPQIDNTYRAAAYSSAGPDTGGASAGYRSYAYYEREAAPVHHQDPGRPAVIKSTVTYPGGYRDVTPPPVQDYGYNDTPAHPAGPAPDPWGQSGQWQPLDPWGGQAQVEWMGKSTAPVPGYETGGYSRTITRTRTHSSSGGYIESRTRTITRIGNRTETVTTSSITPRY